MKIITLLLPLFLLLTTGFAPGADVLTVGATAVPHAEILDFVKPGLQAKGVDLEVKVFTDYVQPNVQVAEKHLDANYFEHLPFLEEFNRNRHASLIPVVAVHLEPFGAYSAKHKTTGELPDGATVAIPNDPSNSGRALQLLAKAGLIKLKDPGLVLATTRDLTDNPKHLRIIEMEAATLPRILNQVDLALINTNYALAAKLNPKSDALFIEEGHSPYANYLVTRPEEKDRPAIQKLAAALTSPEVRAFIETHYHGAVIPAF
ncbi:MAG TPA: MetQ/NlpA family ABC transporter substrate-binding protein [Chthoniobacterales bacterium]